MASILSLQSPRPVYTGDHPDRLDEFEPGDQVDFL